MTGLDILEKILVAREKYKKMNYKYPEFLIISNNLYFKLYKYIEDIAPLIIDPGELLTEPTIAGMTVKTISDNGILIVGCNEILKQKGGFKDE